MAEASNTKFPSSKPHDPAPATEDVRMTRFRVFFAFAAEASTFCVPFKAGSIRSF